MLVSCEVVAASNMIISFEFEYHICFPSIIMLALGGDMLIAAPSLIGVLNVYLCACSALSGVLDEYSI